MCALPPAAWAGQLAVVEGLGRVEDFDRNELLALQVLCAQDRAEAAGTRERGSPARNPAKERLRRRGPAPALAFASGFGDAPRAGEGARRILESI